MAGDWSDVVSPPREEWGGVFYAQGPGCYASFIRRCIQAARSERVEPGGFATGRITKFASEGCREFRFHDEMLSTRAADSKVRAAMLSRIIDVRY